VEAPPPADRKKGYGREKPVIEEGGGTGKEEEMPWRRRKG